MHKRLVLQPVSLIAGTGRKTGGEQHESVLKLTTVFPQAACYCGKV